MSKTPTGEDRELSQLLKQLRKTYLDDAQDDAKKLETIDRLTTEIDILFSVYKKN